MIKKFFAWLAGNELARKQMEIINLQNEVELHKRNGHSYLERENEKLKTELKELRQHLQKVNQYSELRIQLRDHALYLEKFAAQEQQRTAGLQHVILWAIDADQELKLLTQGKTKEYIDLRNTLERIFNSYGITGLKE